jgi:DNA-binding CsgD family transcriptional regulator
MPGRSMNALAVAAEVTGIASMPASPQERAEAMLEPLRRVVPFVGAWISLLDPELSEQPPLVSHGYPDALIQYGRSPAGVAEIEQLGLHRLHGAYRHGDLSMNLAEVRSWTEYLVPAGVRGGLSATLFTLDGRYLGLLGLTTDTPKHPTCAARDLVGALVPTIAAALNPMRLISAAALIIRDAQAAVVLTRAGKTLPVPGLPGHPLLHQGSPVLGVAATILAAQGEYAAFLCPYATADADGEVRVTVLDCAKHPPYYLTGAVVVSPASVRHRLDRTELEILGLLLEDWSPRRIAAALAVDENAIRDAIATIQDKLAAPSPGIALMRAVRQGTYIPRALSRAGQ